MKKSELGFLVLIVLGFMAVLWITGTTDWHPGVIIIVICVSIVLTAVIWTRGEVRRAEARKKSQSKLVKEVAESYQEVLAKKRVQLLVEDDYGDLDDEKWVKELQRFFDDRSEDL